MAISESSTADLDVVVRDNWGSGIVVDVTVMAEQSLGNWTIEFEYAGDIVNIWNANIVSQTGNRYVVENVGYNGAVAAGATTTFGFQGSGSSAEITPISINGDAFDGVPADPDPVDPDPMDDDDTADGGIGGGDGGGDGGHDMGGGSGGMGGGSGGMGGGSGGNDPFVGGGQTYTVGTTSVVTGFDPTRDVLDLGP
ncbi:MAG: cellulose binding domain-containing protein, partial [Pseudomonadota bacterium]